jgi:hypothetical protein
MTVSQGVRSPIDFGQRGVMLRPGEVRNFIRKTYIHGYGLLNMCIPRRRT